MIKLFLLSIILPVLAGSTAGQADLREYYPKQIIYKDNSASVLPSDVKTFVNATFRDKGCNPSVLYKIQKESVFPITNFHGETVFVYTVEFRAFGETDQKSFNGYESDKKFRSRSVSVRQNAEGLSVADINCEKILAKK